MIGESKLNTNTPSNNPVNQSLISKAKDIMKDLSPLKDYTILALSNLLSSNIESGLQYSLSMGYHEDSKTRASFMQVLTNILNQGIDFTSLLQSTDKDKFNRIIKIIWG